MQRNWRYSSRRERNRGDKAEKKTRVKGYEGSWGDKGGSKKEEKTQEKSGGWRGWGASTCSLIFPAVPALPALFLACWHAGAHRDWVYECLPCPLFVCLPEVSTFNMQSDGNCSRSLPYYSSGTHVSITSVFSLSISLSIFYSNSLPSLFSSAPCSFFFLSLPAFLCSTASIHNSSIALVTHCAEDSSTDSQATTVHEAIRAAARPLGHMREFSWKYFIGAEDSVVCVRTLTCVNESAFACCWLSEWLRGMVSRKHTLIHRVLFRRRWAVVSPAHSVYCVWANTSYL